MDPAIQALFDKDTLAKVVERYDAVVSGVTLLDGFENFVYLLDLRGAPAVLRVSHSGRRPADMVRGEVEWINYLADRQVPAARALESVRGNLVEVVPAAAGEFVAVVFERAPGGHVQKDDWGPDLFFRLGQLVGRMHALTRGYEPSDPTIKRPDWYQETAGFVGQRLPASQKKVIRKFDELVDHLTTLPTRRDSYGLVHTDVHAGNFFFSDGQVTLFDFDDCQYSWFVDDIAMAVFYSVPLASPDDVISSMARIFFTHFMAGYRPENDLDPEWLEHIPAFLKLRELLVYAAIYEHVEGDMSRLGDWDGRLMDGRMDRIINNVPFVDLDFVQLAVQTQG